MARAYSDDLRERVAVAVAAGRSCRTVAKLFGVSVSSVVKWSQRYRQSGSAAAKPMGGVRRAVLADHRAWLLERIKQKPDLTLQAIRSELAARGVIVSLWAVWKFYASEKMTFKKKPAAI
jgi:transposase